MINGEDHKIKSRGHLEQKCKNSFLAHNIFVANRSIHVKLKPACFPPYSRHIISYISTAEMHIFQSVPRSH